MARPGRRGDELLTHAREPRESRWRLRYELVTTLALLWAAGAGRTGAPRPDVHLYLADRYARLSRCYELDGRRDRAARLREKAESHYHAADPNGAPPAAAMAMPVPHGAVLTDARGVDSGTDDSDAA